MSAKTEHHEEHKTKNKTSNLHGWLSDSKITNEIRRPVWEGKVEFNLQSHWRLFQNISHAFVCFKPAKPIEKRLLTEHSSVSRLTGPNQDYHSWYLSETLCWQVTKGWRIMTANTFCLCFVLIDKVICLWEIYGHKVGVLVYHQHNLPCFPQVQLA